jgi:hypothetical protein
MDDIEDWGMKLKFNISAAPFTNLTTKRGRESSRIKSKEGRDYIEDYR